MEYRIHFEMKGADIIGDRIVTADTASDALVMAKGLLIKDLCEEVTRQVNNDAVFSATAIATT